MWRIKRRRTKPIENKAKTGVIYPKFNATAKPKRYVNRNTYLDVKCNRNKGAGCTIVGCQCSTDASGNIYCCKTTPYRNPILGYRKHLIDCSGNTDLSGCGYTNDVSGNVYKDNYAKSCTNSLVCYNQVIRTKQNKNGCVDESYNYSTNQYLTRRCLTFSQQEFNFISQVPVDASGSCTKFMSCANCQYNSSGMCDCSSNGFCTGINKLPCEVKNTKCFAIYKRSNPKFNRQGAVSGGSRINRLKYQTRVVAAQRRKANGRNNVINGRGPAALYTTSRPPQMNAPGCWLNKDRTKTGLAQRCIVTDPCCCPTTSGNQSITASYTKVFSGLDIYDNGELYELTATIRKDSFKVACCQKFNYSTASQPTYDINGDLLRTMYGSFALGEIVFWKVGWKFDKELPSTTGIVYVNLISNVGGQEPTGNSEGGSGIPATPSTTTTTRIYFQSHVGPPEYSDVIQITAADEVKKFSIQMLDKTDPNNNTKVLDDSLLIDFNILWLDPPP